MENVAFSTFAVIYEGGKANRFSGKIPKGATVLPNDRVSLGHSRQSRTLVGSLTKKKTSKPENNSDKKTKNKMIYHLVDMDSPCEQLVANHAEPSKDFSFGWSDFPSISVIGDVHIIQPSMPFCHENKRQEKRQEKAWDPTEKLSIRSCGGATTTEALAQQNEA